MKNPLVLFVGAAVVAVAALAGAMADRWQDWPGPVQPTAASPETVAGGAAEPTGEPSGGQASKLPPPAAATGEQAPPELRREQPVGADAGPAPQEPNEQVAAVGADEIREIESPEDIESHQEVESPEAIESSGEIAEARVEEPAVATEEPTAELSEERAESERLAAVDARDVQPAEPSAPAEPEVAPESEPEPGPGPEASAQPSFDVVRLEEDGSLIVAGLAAPGAEVTLLLDGEAIASDAANDFGAWLLMPNTPLPPGSHQLMVQARDAGSGAETSGTIAVAVPERSADRPRVAHSEPAPPPGEDDDVAVAAPETAESEEPASLQPDEAPPVAPEEEQVALAPEPEQEPDVEVEAPVAEDAERGGSGAEAEEQAAVAPAPDVDLEPEAEPEIERRDIPLALETVDYNDDGDIVFSGRAEPGGVVRIHVDNRFVGETTVETDGRWVFAGGNRITPGRHTLRADLIGADGNVVGRIILPFVRADGREVAALVESRRETAAREEATKVETPETAEAEAEPEAPVVADEIAPEPEPEASAIVDAEPEPEHEPEVPAVVDVAPEPEPESPAVAELEPEPQPQAEAPVAADEVAPEPEPQPDAPVIADEVAPQPEPSPEAPVVADEMTPAPEAEPDTAGTEQAAPGPDAAAEVAAAEPDTVEPSRTAEPVAEEPAPDDGEPEVAAARPGHVVIQPGNNLWRISRVIYGRGVEYTAIYEANRDKIRDPDLIYPGQIFATPGVDPPKEIDPAWREPLGPDDLARQDAAE